MKVHAAIPTTERLLQGHELGEAWQAYKGVGGSSPGWHGQESPQYTRSFPSLFAAIVRVTPIMPLLSAKHAVLVGLAANSLASPVPNSPLFTLGRRQDNITQPTQPDQATQPDVSVEDFCANVDLKSIDGAKSVWNGKSDGILQKTKLMGYLALDRGVGAFHDEFLSADSYANEGTWLDKMASDAFPTSGDTGSFGCGHRDQACFNSLPNCQTMFEQGRGKEWWIFNSVQKMQDVFERAHENLQDSVGRHRIILHIARSSGTNSWDRSSTPPSQSAASPKTFL